MIFHYSCLAKLIFVLCPYNALTGSEDWKESGIKRT